MKTSILILAVLAFLFVAGCTGSTPNNQPTVNNPAPQAQTPQPAVQQPAPTQTYACPDGTVVTDLSKCQKQKCTDGTEYDKCSSSKPKYCENGVLTDKSSLCGCDDGYLVSGDSCQDRIVGCWYKQAGNELDTTQYLKFEEGGVGVDKEMYVFPMTWERKTATSLIIEATGLATIKFPVKQDTVNSISVGTLGTYQKGDCSLIDTKKKVNEKYCPQLPSVPQGGLKPGTYSDFELNSDVLKQVNWDGWEWNKYTIYGKDIYSSLSCNKGKNEGENVNYVYCTSSLYQLTKSFSNENGEVEKVARYYMKWVYIPSNGDYTINEIQYYENMFDDESVCTSQYG